MFQQGTVSLLFLLPPPPLAGEGWGGGAPEKIKIRKEPPSLAFPRKRGKGSWLKPSSYSLVVLPRIADERIQLGERRVQREPLRLAQRSQRLGLAPLRRRQYGMVESLALGRN